MKVSRDEVRRIDPKLCRCCDSVLSTLEIGECGERSGELLLSGDDASLWTSLPSVLTGPEERDDVCPVLLPVTEEEAEEEAERVGLC